MKNYIKIFILFIIVLISFNCYAKKYDILFGWDKNTEQDLAGYKLYNYNTSNAYIDGNLIANIQDPNASTYFINNFEINTETYFILTAYDTSYNESGPSNQVMFMPDLIPPAKPNNFNIKDITIIIRFK